MEIGFRWLRQVKVRETVHGHDRVIRCGQNQRGDRNRRNQGCRRRLVIVIFRVAKTADRSRDAIVQLAERLGPRSSTHLHQIGRLTDVFGQPAEEIADEVAVVTAQHRSLEVVAASPQVDRRGYGNQTSPAAGPFGYVVQSGTQSPSGAEQLVATERNADGGQVAVTGQFGDSCQGRQAIVAASGMRQPAAVIGGNATTTHFQPKDANTQSCELISQADHVGRHATAAQTVNQHHRRIARLPMRRLVVVQRDLVAVGKRDPVQFRPQMQDFGRTQRQQRLQMAATNPAMRIERWWFTTDAELLYSLTCHRWVLVSDRSYCRNLLNHRRVRHCRMHTIRSFIAIPLSPEVQRNARRLMRDLRQEKDGIKWVPEDNLHLTLKFLGEVIDRDVPAVCQAIRNVCQSIDPFALEFAGAGGFPTSERPRVIWAGIVDGGDSLVALVTALETELAKLGFKPDPRDYRPHLTLGRVKSSSRSAGDELVDRVQRNADRKLGLMAADQVKLIASFLDRDGPTYNVMDTIWLGRPASDPGDD